jgi:molybdate transport system substrate-binding protein
VRRPKRNRVLAFLGIAALVSCGGSSDSDPSALTVFAASSLTGAMPEIMDAFISEYPGSKVKVQFGSSSDLAIQIIEGAPFDVFASADRTNMSKVEEANLVNASATMFASNTFAIIVEKGNPLDIKSIADLAEPDVVVVQCATTAPCGQGALTVFKNAGISLTPKSFEENVKSVVTKVSSGEADAGIVYVTDVIAAEQQTDEIAIEAGFNTTTDYYVAASNRSSDVELAQRFADFVVSPLAQEILRKYGFVPAVGGK